MTSTIDPTAESVPESLEFKAALLAERPSVGTDANTVVDPDTHEVTAVVAVTGVRDDVGDIIVPGAFERSLGERPKPKVCLGHDWNRPIGKTTHIAEYRPGDPKLPKTTYDGKPWPKEAGALIARYVPDLSTEDGRNAFNSAKFYGKDESTFSIGYKTRQARHSDDTRHLHDLDLYEYGPVLVPANRLAALLDIKNDEEGIEHTALEPDESKVKQVRDVAYWGEPYGTPITGDMHPHGPKARAERREGRVPSRNVGVISEAGRAASPDRAPRISAVARAAEKPDGLMPEPASDARVLPHPTRAKGKDQNHINDLADHIAEGGASPDASDDQRALVDRSVRGLLDEAITPNEVDQRLRQHPALSDVQRQGEEGRENPHGDDIASAVADYTARYRALANQQHSVGAPIPNRAHYAQMSNAQVAASGESARNIATAMHDNGTATTHPAYQQAMAHVTGAENEMARRDRLAASHPAVARAHQQGLDYARANPALATERARALVEERNAALARNAKQPPEQGSPQERLPHQLLAMTHGLRGQDMAGQKLPPEQLAPKPSISAGDAARTGVPTGNSDRDASALTIMNRERGHAMVSGMSDESLAGVDKELAGRAAALGKPGQVSTAHQVVKSEIAKRAELVRRAQEPKAPPVGEPLNGRTLPYTVLSREGKRNATVEFQGNHYQVEHHGGVLGHVVVTDPLGAQTKVSGGSTLELPSSRASNRERAVREALGKAHDNYTQRLATDQGASELDLAKRHANTLPALDRGEQQSRVEHFSDGLLSALDTEMGTRAAALGKPGQVSPTHQVVKDELAHRAQRGNDAETARRAAQEGRTITSGGAPGGIGGTARTKGEARKLTGAGAALTGIGAPGTGVINAHEVDEVTKASDEAHGLYEHPDGHLEVDKSVADRQDRIESLLNDHAAGKLALGAKSTDDLHQHRTELNTELSLQNLIARHDAANPVKPKAPAKPKVASEGPKVRPGLAGAAQDHAEALRSGDQAAIERTRSRLNSSIRRSRAGSDTARTLADHVGSGEVDAGRLDSLATSLKNESRTRNSAAARSRRTAKRLDRDRIRSVLGSVDTELRSRGEAPTLRDEPGAPVAYTDAIAARADKGVPRKLGGAIKPGDVIPMRVTGASSKEGGNRSWQRVGAVTSPKENGTSSFHYVSTSGEHSTVASGNEYVQVHGPVEKQRVGEAAKPGNVEGEIKPGSTITGTHPFYGAFTGKVTKVHENGGVVAKLTTAKRLPKGRTSGNIAVRRSNITSVRNLATGEHDTRAAEEAIKAPEAAKPAPPKTITPLTDAEYAKHTKMVEDTLNREIKAGNTTDRQFTVRGEGKIYSGNRARMHSDIVNALWDKNGANVPTEGKSVIAGGLGGAGKSTVLKGHAGIDTSHYLTINPDDIKEEFAKRGMVPDVKGLSPMEASALVHEESSHVANMLAQRAYANKTNVMWDITMSSKGSVDKRITEMAKHGYSKPDAVFVDIPVETSVSRALSRHRRGMEKFRSGEGPGGRYVPPSIIRKNSSSTSSSANRDVFESLKDKFGSHVVYDNSVAGREPQKITGNGRWGVGTSGLENFHPTDTPEERNSKLIEHYRFLGENGVHGPYRSPAAVNDSLRSIGAPTSIAGDDATPELKAQAAQMLAPHVGPHAPTPRIAIRNLDNEMGSNDLSKKGGVAAQYWNGNQLIEISPKTLGTTGEFKNGAGFFSNSGDANFAQRSMSHEYGHHLDHVLEDNSPATYNKMMDEVLGALGRRKPRATPAGEIRGAYSPVGWLAKNKSKIVNRVSTYGATNRRELMAELYAEYKHAAKPSKAATIAGDYLTGRKR